MVLSDLDPPSSFGDGSPQSENDQYGGANPWNNPSIMNEATLPKPCPGTSILGYNNANLAKAVQERFQTNQNLIKRPATAEEASALVYWAAKQRSIMSYGTPIGVAAGLYRAYQTASVFRFPFLKPEFAPFDPKVFPNQRYALFKGVRAVNAWHAIRMLAYGTVGNFVSVYFFSSFSVIYAAAGAFRDKRLAKFFADARANVQAQNKAGVPKPMPQQHGVAPLPERPAPRTTEDDASPSAGGTDWIRNDNGPSSSDWAVEPVEPREQPAPAAQASDFSVEADDASPTNGRGVVDDTASGESAWERIRRQSASKDTPSAWHSAQSSSEQNETKWY